MIFGKKVLAIIPARGGSKRLPQKNSKLLHGKPLIVHSIEAAKQAEVIDEILVSTDDLDIAKIACEAGAYVPFLRPDYLSTDQASSVDVVCHAIEYLQRYKKMDFEYIVLLQPTSPLRKALHIQEAFDILEEKKGDAVISVCEVEHSPLWINQLPEDGSMIEFISSEIKGTRSQDLPQYYRVNGAIYICSIPRFLKEKDFFISDNIYAYKMRTYESVDIDTMIDFLLC